MFAGRSLIATLYAARRDRAYLADLTARVLAVAFVFYGLLAVGILVINVPPFQIPDEHEHFVRAALVVGLVAAILGLGGVPVTLTKRLLIAAVLLLSMAGAFLLIYVTFDVPGNPTVDHVQGRYFLPIALAGVILVSGLANSRWQPVLYATLVATLIAFPVLTISVVTRALVLRYYLG